MASELQQGARRTPSDAGCRSTPRDAYGWLPRDHEDPACLGYGLLRGACGSRGGWGSEQAAVRGAGQAYVGAVHAAAETAAGDDDGRKASGEAEKLERGPYWVRLSGEEAEQEKQGGPWRFKRLAHPDLCRREWVEEPEFDHSGWDVIQVPSSMEVAAIRPSAKSAASGIDVGSKRKAGEEGRKSREDDVRGDALPIVYSNYNYSIPLDPPRVPLEENPTGVYVKRFPGLPLSWKSAGRMRLFLVLEGVDACCHVWVNGQLVGFAKDGKLPSVFEVTGLLGFGQQVGGGRKENVLAVRCMQWCDGSYLERQDMWSFTGIHRGVYVYAKHHDAHIEDFALGTASVDLVGPDAPGKARSAEVTCTVSVTAGKRYVRELQPLVRHGIREEIPGYVLPYKAVLALHRRARRADGVDAGRDSAEAAALEWEPVPGVAPTEARVEGCPPGSTRAAAQLRMNIKLPPGDGGDGFVRLWSAEDPYLYMASVTLVGCGKENVGEVVDAEAWPLGIRTSRVDRSVGKLLVNGQPVLFKGVNRHEHDPYTGRHVSRASMVRDVQLMKAFGFNAVRTSHYPNDSFLYRVCDALGMYVVDEANVETHGFDAHFTQTGYSGPATDPAFLASLVDRCARMCLRDRNHASIIAWSIGNEAQYGFAHDAMYAAVKGLDAVQDRPVQYEGGGSATHATDVVCPMYAKVDQIRGMAVRYPERPVILCEYSHAMGNSNGGLGRYWDAFYNAVGDPAVNPGGRLQGGFIWDWVDQGLPLARGTRKGDARFDGWGYGGDFGSAWNGHTDKQFCVNGLVFPDRTPHPALAECRYLFQDVDIRAEPMHPHPRPGGGTDGDREKDTHRGHVVMRVRFTHRGFFVPLEGLFARTSIAVPIPGSIQVSEVHALEFEEEERGAGGGGNRPGVLRPQTSRVARVRIPLGGYGQDASAVSGSPHALRAWDAVPVMLTVVLFRGERDAHDNAVARRVAAEQLALPAHLVPKSIARSLKLSPWAPTPPGAAGVGAALSVQVSGDGGWKIDVTGAQGDRLTFEHGRLVSWRSSRMRGEEVLAGTRGGPRVCLWRAPTDNDQGGDEALRGIGPGSGESHASSWARAGLQGAWEEERAAILASVVRVRDPGDPAPSIDAAAAGESSRSVQISFREEHHHQGERFAFSCSVDWSYTVHVDGRLSVDARVAPWSDDPNLESLARVGLSMALRVPSASDRPAVRWIGRGPHECYPDRCRGAFVGEWQCDVDELAAPYIYPGEAGGRCDVRSAQVCVSPATGQGVAISAWGPLGEGTEMNRGDGFALLNCSRVPQSVVAQATHQRDLSPERARAGAAALLPDLPDGAALPVWVHLDAAHMGLGGDDSWSKAVHADALVPPNKPYHVHACFTPFT